MRPSDYPEAEAKAAIEALLSLRWLHEEGEPVGSELADDALDIAAEELHRSGLLAMLITRASKLYWPRT